MFNINKKYRTRDGREVIIHAERCPNPTKPLIVSIRNTNDVGWWTTHYPESGRFVDYRPGENDLDLIEVREPREFLITADGFKALGKSNGGVGMDEEIHVREVLP